MNFKHPKIKIKMDSDYIYIWCSFVALVICLTQHLRLFFYPAHFANNRQLVLKRTIVTRTMDGQKMKTKFSRAQIGDKC